MTSDQLVHRHLARTVNASWSGRGSPVVVLVYTRWPLPGRLLARFAAGRAVHRSHPSTPWQRTRQQREGPVAAGFPASHGPQRGTAWRVHYRQPRGDR